MVGLASLPGTDSISSMTGLMSSLTRLKYISKQTTLMLPKVACFVIHTDDLEFACRMERRGYWKLET
jgi:hypothetical protein